MNTAVVGIDEMDRPAVEQSAQLLNAAPAAGEQAWWGKMRRDSWELFQRLPMPARGDEAWRFATLKRLDLSEFSQPLPVRPDDREEIISRSRALKENAGRMVIANDQLVRREIHSAALDAKGVIWLPLEQAAAEHPELLQKHFMRAEALLGGRKFAALHRSQLRSGSFLYIPRGVEIELPLEIFHWLHGQGGSCFPHTLIIAETMSKVTVVDHFASSDASASGFAAGVNDLWLGDGAQVTYVCTQNWSRKAVSVQINSTVVGRDAHAVALNLNLGGSFARSESVSHLRGPGGRSDMLAVSIADGSQEFDQRTLQIHEVPNTASDLLYKNSLDDKARTIFAGLIRVNPGAHKTDAYQKVRNLLLSDEAEANSAPGLEIEADDVRCTHGATSGQIEEEELFYLRSRGIPKAEAQRLIVHGFLQEVIDRLGNDLLGAVLTDMIQQKFERRFPHG